MTTLKAIIDRNSQGKKVLALFILTNVIYLIMVVVTIPQVSEYANGLKLLDMMPMGYDLPYVNTLFDTLGTRAEMRTCIANFPWICYILGFSA